jgi:hypothetical protein
MTVEKNVVTMDYVDAAAASPSLARGWAAVVRGWNGAGTQIGLGPAMPYINYVLGCLWDQLRVVAPIVLYLVLYLLAVFGRTIADAGAVCLGLLVLMVGLALFLEGLRLALMPLGRIVGERLPAKVSFWAVLAVTFVLGVAVTLAEPAIGALQTLGTLVDPVDSPYLFLTLNDYATFLVLSIGLGVGAAAVLGILRFQYVWSMKTLVYLTVPPTLALSAVVVFAFTGLEGVLGLAWDSGAITTGPVTVPIVLALGIGVATHRRLSAPARTSPQRQEETAPLIAPETTAVAADDDSMPGFGIVTLASLFPIVAVMAQGMLTTALSPPGAGADDGSGSGASNNTGGDFPPWEFDSPVVEVALAVRAILPLVVLLVSILKCLVCDPFPNEPFLPADATDKPALQAIETNAGAALIHHAAGLPALGSAVDLAAGAGGEAAAATAAGPATTSTMSASAAAAAAASASARMAVVVNDSDGDGALDAAKPSSSTGGSGAWAARYGTFVGGVAASFVGMVLFNWGLTYGLSELGEQVGAVLPAAFMAVPDVPGSPLYDRGLGLFLVFLFAFVLGVLATVAEPALSVMGTEVQRLTRGRLTKTLLILAVALGVGAGVTVGVAIVVLDLDLLYFLLGGYAIALALTVVSSEQIATIAWDSAGVTTGPVTVPFVLSLGVSLGGAVGATSGFGILTMASVGPIIAVLLIDVGGRVARAVRPAR